MFNIFGRAPLPLLSRHAQIVKTIKYFLKPKSIQKAYDFVVGNFRLKEAEPKLKATRLLKANPSLLFLLLLHKIIPQIQA
jgi:hypothetical protein